MKIGTDSLILGCLAKAKKPQHILDIGTGTGLLALMMAQKFTEAKITAIDIDETAATEATYNALQSKWVNRIVVSNLSLQDFMLSNQQLFDLIITNPPYFVSNNHYPILPANRKLARQTIELPFEILLVNISKLLSVNGICWMVLPTGIAIDVIEKAQKYHLFNNHCIMVSPNENKPFNRIIFSLSKQNTSVTTATFYIYKSGGNEHTDTYKTTVADFLL